RARNAWAEAKVSGRQPALRINSSSDSRTDRSSSTMKTIGVAFGMGGSLPSERGIDGVQQSRLAERLRETLDRPRLERAGTDGFVSESGDEDDRNLLPAPRELLLEIEPRHAGHRDVEDQTSGLLDGARRQELFCRGEGLGRKAARPQQVGQRLAH